MNAQSRLVQFLTAPFFGWCALLVIGTSFMVSFDKKKLKEIPSDATIMQTVNGYFGAMKFSQIKKGIDLEGGTYLVLGVEIEKAIENRLVIESKALDDLFSKSDERTLKPVKKTVTGRVLTVEFETEASARSCVNLLKEQRGHVFKSTSVDNVVSINLLADVEQNIRVNAVDQAVNVMSNRLSGYGVGGIAVQQHGERQVVVQLPGVDDPDRVKSILSKTANLELKIVEESSGSKETLLDKFDGELPSDKVIIPGKKEKDGSGYREWYLVSAFADLTGDHITHAEVSRDKFNKPQVTFKLDAPGSREFAEITGRNVGRLLGVVIDDVMYTAARISEEISGGNVSITGSFTFQESKDLSIVLRSGALAAPLKFEQESRVGASLGQDSINRGMISCLVALLFLCIFSIFYYKVPGFFAVLALLYNLFLIMLFLSYFKATLTLPGIAGMVLTIGMAIDSSILIYENIKEYLLAGEPLRNAIQKGFGGVMMVIFDSNLTTFLTGFILYQFGGPAIKGFAVTLMAGIVATLLAGVMFLRSLFTFSLEVLGTRDIKF